MKITKPIKPRMAFTCVDCTGTINTFYTRGHKRDAIRALRDNMWSEQWASLRRKGWRCIRVEVRPL